MIADAHGAEGLKSSVYLMIDPDGTVNIDIHRVEMGQGSRTGLPQIIADELDADWNRINFLPAHGDKKFGDQKHGWFDFNPYVLHGLSAGGCCRTCNAGSGSRQRMGCGRI